MQNTDALVGQTLDGKYRIDAELGRGGMGAVFRATHLGTGRTVALKALAARLAGEAEFLERFRREAKAAGCLRHPNIVDITDFGVAEVRGAAVPYLVMEYLDGQTLGAILEENPKLPLTFVVEVVEQVASALAEAHGRGILHRDLKPDNLWLEPDRRGGYRVKVLDFGLAKTLEAPRSPREPVSGEATPVDRNQSTVASDEDLTREMSRASSGPALTQVGAILGTPAYMSPEQCRGGELDVRSDVYSLAVIVHQMLAGQALFSGSSQDLLVKHLQARPPELKELRPDIPRAVTKVVMSALTKDPADRPESSAAFALSLAAYAEGPWQLFQRSLTFYLEHARRILKVSLRCHLMLILALPLWVCSEILFTPQVLRDLRIFLPLYLWLGWMACFIHCQNLTWTAMPALVALSNGSRPGSVDLSFPKPYRRRQWGVIAQLAVVSLACAMFCFAVLIMAFAIGTAMTAHDGAVRGGIFMGILGAGILVFIGPGYRYTGVLLLYSQERLLRGGKTREALGHAKALLDVFSRLRDFNFIILVCAIIFFGFTACIYTLMHLDEGWRGLLSNLMALTLAAIVIDPLLGILGTRIYFKACSASGISPTNLADRFEAEIFKP